MAIIATASISQLAIAADAYPAELVSHALLPSQTFISAPSDAPKDLQVSGKYTTGKLIEKLGSVEGKSAGRPTGIKLPFPGQPVQGHSGIQYMPDGSYWILTDNGFGSKANSPDAMLFMRQYKIDWDKGVFEPIKTIFFNDQNKVISHRITQQDSDRRYLTGSDFDPESFQIINGDIWVGEEFGPWLLRFDSEGTLKTMYDTKVDGKTVYSPDHPTLQLPSKPDDKLPLYDIKRSKGFEGMASAPDGRYLYPMLEGPVYNHKRQQYDSVDGHDFLRILQFDTKRNAYTDKSWKYVLDDNEHAIGDFNMIDDTYGLIIERDNLEGVSDKACQKPAVDTSKCFDKPAVFKRIYKVKLDPKSEIAEKVAYIDLMAIKDTKGAAKKSLVDDKFVFPFFTIENVDIVDESHIVVGNDNNLPFSSSRDPNRADDNELLLLEIKDFLKAK
ncbi:MAG: esterase-like activity of phytase family protein [Psychrobacter sp.]|uniref:esterase-like activity of phytase family protein n=1 Tax=Psychrobacter sp. AOP7-B1-24 TaxID=3457645 RepID=UPI003FB752A8